MPGAAITHVTPQDEFSTELLSALRAGVNEGLSNVSRNFVISCKLEHLLYFLSVSMFSQQSISVLKWEEWALAQYTQFKFTLTRKRYYYLLILINQVITEIGSKNFISCGQFVWPVTKRESKWESDTGLVWNSNGHKFSDHCVTRPFSLVKLS